MRDQSLETLRNQGVVRLRDQTPEDARAPTRTILVTGVARSGTSMIAQVLSRCGLNMGDRHDRVVFEDLLAHDAISTNDPDILGQYIRDRDQAAPAWGLKRPHMHLLGSGVLSMFRNPRLVVSFRDPVAIACRNVISEGIHQRTALSEAMQDLQAMLAFALDADCPVMLISYEKALVHPTVFIEELTSFCGFAETRPDILSMLGDVDPEPRAYLLDARRHFEGYVDKIENGILTGWARQLSSPAPEQVEVFIDGQAVATVSADRPRADLDAAGIGAHAFEVDLTRFRGSESPVVDVRIAGRAFALENSGRSFRDLETA